MQGRVSFWFRDKKLWGARDKVCGSQSCASLKTGKVLPGRLNTSRFRV